MAYLCAGLYVKDHMTTRKEEKEAELMAGCETEPMIQNCKMAERMFVMYCTLDSNYLKSLMNVKWDQFDNDQMFTENNLKVMLRANITANSKPIESIKLYWAGAQLNEERHFGQGQLKELGRTWKKHHILQFSGREYSRETAQTYLGGKYLAQHELLITTVYFQL